ncbi:MAG: UDP-N-acetylmuramoyl-tripeptide--D-alanyl-D-alanine ligase [Thermodesulfovibrio sp.]|nr:UDP-N-acetylmuramoyl-tripeptide--D-alanyl-D-alanine ligase [Thermodesulfovibrio sp.]
MAYLKTEDILAATGGTLLCEGPGAYTGVSIDSRTIADNELFVALQGSRSDGHQYLAAALIRGAGALVSIAPQEMPSGKTLVLVNDPLKALQALAEYLRQKRAVPVIAVTGTNGKTTTKELVASIFSTESGQQKVLKTSANLNNHIGLPLCLSRMQGDEEVMVLEMGSNASGDIRLLCDIARPDYAVMTNVGPAHLEGFGSLEAIRATDLEVLEYVRTFAVNADDLFLMAGLAQDAAGYTGRTITYGIDNPADVSARDIRLHEKGSDFLLCLPGGPEVPVQLQLSGRFNISNALAAAAISSAAGAPPDSIRKGLEAFTGVPMRLEIRKLGGMLIISDVYNANPSSMQEAIRELLRLKRERTIAVLGDMLELGAYAEAAHSGIMTLLNELNITMLISVGREMQKASAAFRGDCYNADDSFQAGAILADLAREGDTVLLKGSRGMRMEQVLGELETSFAGGGDAL